MIEEINRRRKNACKADLTACCYLAVEFYHSIARKQASSYPNTTKSKYRQFYHLRKSFLFKHYVTEVWSAAAQNMNQRKSGYVCRAL